MGDRLSQCARGVSADLRRVPRWGASQGGSELEPINRAVALIAAIIFGIPTLLLGVLMFIRRLARLAAAVATCWMAFTAIVWLPVYSVVGGCALLAALVVLCSLAFDWRQAQVGSTRSRPHR
jgi:hypothetical protein